MTDKTQYQKIDVTSLRAGMLLDRSLSLYFPRNDKYILVASRLRPLEQRVLDKIKKHGEVFSNEQSIFEEHTLLKNSIEKFYEIINQDELASFEKSIKIKETLMWMRDFIFPEGGFKKVRPNLDPIVFFMVHILEVPTDATFSYLSDQSLDLCSYSISTAATAGFLALMLGYHDTEFLKSFVTTVFCSEVGLLEDVQSPELIEYLMGRPAALSDEDKIKLKSRFDKTVVKINSSQVPGIGILDQRLAMILKTTLSSQIHFIDDLQSLVSVSRWFSSISIGESSADRPNYCTVLPKISSVFSISFESFREVAV